MSEREKELPAIAWFHKKPNGRFELFSLVTAPADFRYYTMYDVDWSKTYGQYYYHNSGCGPLMPDNPMEVDGIYWSAKAALVKEKPCALVNRAARRVNKTRRLTAIPKAFRANRFSGTPHTDIFQWLENEGICDETVYCSECEDLLPNEQPCEHIWWCDKTAMWSAPDERLTCRCETCVYNLARQEA